MQEQKFTIAGDIEHPEEPKKKGDLWLRFTLFIIAVAVLAGVLLFPFLQDSFPALRKLTNNPDNAPSDTALHQYKLLKKSYDSLAFANDSLLLETKKEGPKTVPAETGRVYEIQVKALKDFDMERYKPGMGLMQVEYDNGWYKFTLGKFSDEKTAQAFLKEVKKIGFKDAWIVAKENGIRLKDYK